MGALVRGTVFDVSVDDPKARVQAFLDDYKDHPDDAPEVGLNLMASTLIAKSGSLSANTDTFWPTDL